MEPPTPTAQPPAAATAHGQRPLAGARCLACDYLLEGLPTPTCPECGRPFDPDDPGSYFPPWFRSRLAHRLSRRWAAPPPLWQLAGYVLLLWLLWPTPDRRRLPFDSLGDPKQLFAAGLAPGFALSWILRDWAVGRWGDLHGNGRRVAWWKWWTGPMCVVVLCMVWALGPWASPTFIASYPALQAKAKAVLATGKAENKGQIVGLLGFLRIAPVGKGVKFESREVWSWSGHVASLVYDPTGEQCRSHHVYSVWGDWCWREY